MAARAPHPHPQISVIACSSLSQHLEEGLHASRYLPRSRCLVLSFEIEKGDAVPAQGFREHLPLSTPVIAELQPGTDHGFDTPIVNSLLQDAIAVIESVDDRRAGDSIDVAVGNRGQQCLGVLVDLIPIMTTPETKSVGHDGCPLPFDEFDEFDESYETSILKKLRETDDSNDETE